MCRRGSCSTQSVSDAPACHVEPDAARRAGGRHEGVAPDVALEVDGEIVAAPLPSSRAAEERHRRRAGGTTREPWRIEHLDAVESIDRPRDRPVPASYDEVDRGPWREAPHGADRAEGHEQIADALQAKQQDAARRVRTRAAKEPERPRHGRQREVGEADRRALARVVDAVEVVEQRVLSAGRSCPP